MNSFIGPTYGGPHQVASKSNSKVLTCGFTFPCPKCSKGFNRGDHLRRHLLSVHDHDHPYHCGKCSKRFVTVEILSNHTETAHFGNNDINPLCNWCGRLFSSIPELHRHSASMHRAQDIEYVGKINKMCRVFSCMLCTKLVSSQRTLERHILKAHRKNEHIQRCCQCNATFSSEQELRDHIGIYHLSVSGATLKDKVVRCTVKYTSMQEPVNVNFVPLPLNGVLCNNIKSSHTEHWLSHNKACFQCTMSHTSTSCARSACTHKHVPTDVVFAGGCIKSSTLENFNENISETNTVSEALSVAMRTLSDFSYDSLPQPIDCIPARLSLFHSSAPLPNFHYPHAVQLADPLTLKSSTLDVAQTPYSVVAPEVASLPADQVTCQGKSLGNGEAVSRKQENASQLVDESSTTQARRGRPRKKKKGECNEEEEYGAQTMILKEHDNGAFVKYNCTVCSQTYKGMNNLMQHVEKVHLSMNPHECCICHKTFAQAGNVKRHIRFVHLRERPFQCRDCDSTFDRLCYLQRHMRSHFVSKEITRNTAHLNPCNCPECGKRCLTAQHLRGHMQRKHFAKNKNLSIDFDQKYGHLFDGMDVCKDGSEMKLPITSKKPKIKDRKLGMEQEIDRPFASETPCLVANGAFNKQPASTVTSFPPNSLNSNAVSCNALKTNTPHLKFLLQQGENIATVDERKTATPLQLNYKNAKPQSLANNSALSLSPLQSDFVKGKTFPKIRVYESCCEFIGRRNHFPLKYKCQLCVSRKFAGLHFLKSHIATAHHSAMNRHLCLICGRGYAMKSLLLDHISKRHKSKN